MYFIELQLTSICTLDYSGNCVGHEAAHTEVTEPQMMDQLHS